MKIIEKIIEMELLNKKARLEKMIEFNGPAIIIETLKKQVEEEDIKVSDKLGLGDEEYTSHEVLKGSGGKTYIRFNRNINYFPEGRYGPFISKAQDNNPVKEKKVIKIKNVKCETFTTNEAAKILGITSAQLRKELRKLEGIEKNEKGKYILTNEVIDSLKK